MDFIYGNATAVHALPENYHIKGVAMREELFLI